MTVPGLEIDGPSFSIQPSGPFDFGATTDVLEHWSPVRRFRARPGDPIRLAFAADGSFDPVGVVLDWRGDRVYGRVSGRTSTARAASQVARILALHVDGAGYEAVLNRDPAIARLAAALPGLRPVAFASPYEAVWAILSQRISMAQAEGLQQRLLDEVGSPIDLDGVTVRALASPDRLARLDPIDGLSSVKLERLRSVAEVAASGALDADRLAARGHEAGPASLLALRGIGPFWSQGIYLRGLNISDVFPDEPLAIAALGAVHGLGDRPAPAEIEAITATYAPYRMWVCFLLRVAASRGLVPGIAGREMAIRHAAPSGGLS